jgi:succinoglycan biosynthesis protein ExoM
MTATTTQGLQPRVSICIPTYKRSGQLRQLLASLSRLTFHKVAMPHILVIVVDNDASESSRSTCAAARLPWPLRYVVEPRRGIAQARNRAVREADGFQVVAFIDDDEIAAANWLDELLWRRAESGANVVCGPVLPSFAADVPEWVKTGGFFDRVNYTDDSPDGCRSGNVLIDRKIFTTVDMFDERFGLTGGEDTQFFLRVRRAGYKIVSSPQAAAYETVSTSRANLPWVLRRAYQSGNSWVLCESSLDRKISTRFVRILKACGWIALGGATSCVSPLFGMAAFAQSLRSMWLGAGMLAALAGQSFQAYKAAGTDSTA